MFSRAMYGVNLHIAEQAHIHDTHAAVQIDAPFSA